jgi:hypothetical protein
LTAPRGANRITEAKESAAIGARAVVLCRALFPNCRGLGPETEPNPQQFAPEDDRERPRRANSFPSVMQLTPRSAARASGERARRSTRGAENARAAAAQSSSSTQSIARVTALRHLR